MLQERETEAILLQAKKTLQIVSERTTEAFKSLERCEQERLPSLPLVSLYKRPKFLPTDY